MSLLRIGTRGSALARWQAQTVAGLIETAGGPRCELVLIRTSGDEPLGLRSPNDPGELGRDLAEAATLVSGREGGPHNIKGLFIKEIEDALLEGRIDAAVHSSKDLSSDPPAGLTIAAALPREDPRDAVVLPIGSAPVSDLSSLTTVLGGASRIGTSSVRRSSQLRSNFPAATFVEMRGNVDTRLKKLDRGDCDAIILAAAGLKRLGLASRISYSLPIDVCVPAPGQGTIAVEIRNGDEVSAQLVTAINDGHTMQALLAEQAVVRAVGGGCRMPLGAHAAIDAGQMLLYAIVLSPDGLQMVRAESRGRPEDAAELGARAGQQLLDRGAARILAM